MRFTLIFILLCLLVSACSRSDAKIQQKLTGTWIFDEGYGVHGTLVVGSNGNIKSQITGFKDGHVMVVEGKWLVKNGVLIETLTKVSETNGALPHVNFGRIVRMDKHELVTRWDGMNFDIVEKRAER